MSYQFSNEESLSELVISLSNMKNSIPELGRDAMVFNLKMLLGDSLILNKDSLGLNYVVMYNDLVLVLDMNFQPLFFSIDEWHVGCLVNHIELNDLTGVINKEAQKVLKYKPAGIGNSRCILLDSTICNFVLDCSVHTKINIVDCRDRAIIILGSYTSMNTLAWKEKDSSNNKVYIYNKRLTSIEKVYDNWCTTEPGGMPWVLVNSSKHIWGKIKVILERKTNKPIDFGVTDKIAFDSNDAEDFESYLHSRKSFYKRF